MHTNGAEWRIKTRGRRGVLVFIRAGRWLDRWRVLSLFSPAKLNLSLAITGRRPDGFHDLVSVVVTLDFGDTLEAAVRPGGAGSTLECDDATVPTDASNLILKAAAAFAAATGWREAVHFRLAKRIPMGAGLGGGSSNAVAALRALNQLAGGPLGAVRLAELAAGLGSDCPLFLHGGPVVMRGRGERIEPLPAAAVARLSGRRVLVVKPHFGISTPWAYGRMVARGTDYLPAAEAEARLAAWLAGAADAEAVLFNNMEPAAFEKYVALPVLRERLRRETGARLHMSGSGSACFVLLAPGADVAAIQAALGAAWGPVFFSQIATIA